MRTSIYQRTIGVGAAFAAALGAVVVAGAQPAAAVEPVTETFAVTGAEQTFTVPAFVHRLHVVAIGGKGSFGGFGAVTTAADVPVTPGQTLYVEVGQSGFTRDTPAFNGGAPAVNGGGGGGATDLRSCSMLDQACALTGDRATDPRLVVAGGGGGGGGGEGTPGGRGGTPIGGDGGGGGEHDAKGGGLSAGGLAGFSNYTCDQPDPGVAGAGGAGAVGHCPRDGAPAVVGGGGGGGGGGWFGGGGGPTRVGGQAGIEFTNGGGGAGGSSYAVPSASNVSYALDTTGTPSLTITYQAETTPIADDDAYAVDEDGAFVIAGPGVLDNDTNPAGGPLVALLPTLPAHGFLTLAEDGSFAYLPASNFHGTDRFTYLAENEAGERSERATVTITVRPVNDPPVIEDVIGRAVRWGERLTTSVDVTDIDSPDDDLTFALVDPPAGATIDPATGAFAWTPSAAQVGTHAVTIRVDDNGTPNRSDSTTFQVPVDPRPTELLLDDQEVQFSDPATVTATLVDGANGPLEGTGVAGRTVALAVGSQPAASATTDGDGRATTTFAMSQPSGTSPLTAEFAGDGPYLASTAAAGLTVVPEDATVTVQNGGILIAIGAPIELRATVAEAADGHLGDRLGTTQVRLTLRRATGPTVATCTATVRPTGPGRGTAGCPVRLTGGFGFDTVRVTAELLGQDRYTAPTAQSAPITLLALF